MCKKSFSNIRLLATGGTIFLYHVNQPSRCLHGRLDICVDDSGPSTARLVASNQGLWIVIGKGKNLFNLDSDILSWFLMALTGILAFQNF